MIVNGSYVEINCWKCRVQYCLPSDLYSTAKRDPDIRFFCPHGHSAHYPEGETEADGIRRERDRLKQDQARLEGEVRAAQNRAIKAEAETKRMKKRASAGSCPCCKRTFSNMAAHMKTKHPGFAKPELKVVA